MARPRRYDEGKQISLRIEADLLEKLDVRAKALGVDRSQLINRLLATHINNNPFSTKTTKR
ncbi:MAG: ribbon-helix-helix protein, CopG family [Opitutaceae bacterium]